MMTTILALAAVAWLVWPAKKSATQPTVDLFKLATPPVTAPTAPDSRAAIDSLLAVRDRLAATDSLDDEAGKAVDILWLDLLHGSKR